jgi:hypothetical protein
LWPLEVARFGATLRHRLSRHGDSHQLQASLMRDRDSKKRFSHHIRQTRRRRARLALKRPDNVDGNKSNK